MHLPSSRSGKVNNVLPITSSFEVTRYTWLSLVTEHAQIVICCSDINDNLTTRTGPVQASSHLLFSVQCPRTLVCSRPKLTRIVGSGKQRFTRDSVFRGGG